MNLHQLTASLQHQGFSLLLVSNDRVLPRLNHHPFGIELTGVNFHDAPQVPCDITAMLEIFNLMNGIAHGPRGLAMPNWVMVDLSLLPSAILIAAAPRELLMARAGRAGETMTREHIARQHKLLRLLWEVEERGYDGPIPVAGYCAAPTAEPGRWVGWSLSSVLEGMGLATLVKALALGAYGARHLDGVTQYDNPSLRIHARFGAMGIRAASLPLHTAPRSFIYETDLTAAASIPELLDANGNGKPHAPPTFLLDPGDQERQQDMQRRIVAGERRYQILPPGIITAMGRPLIPILESVTAASEETR